MTAACAPPASTTHLRPPLLVFGGPYSNVRAVTTLRAQAALLGIDAVHTICTGDVVAYCAEPEETVAKVEGASLPNAFSLEDVSCDRSPSRQ